MRAQWIVGLMGGLAAGVVGFATSGASAQCVPLEPAFPTGPLGGQAGVTPRYWDLLSVDQPEGPTLYAAGNFGYMAPSTSFANAPFAVARLREGRWTALRAGQGLDGSTVRRLLWADLSAAGGPGPSLYAAGNVNTANLRLVTRWDEAAGWQPVGGTTLPTGEARTMETFDDGTGTALYVGGSFTSSGNGAVARWRGQENWELIGAPFFDGATLTPVVNDLKVMGIGAPPRLYAAGRFSTAAGLRGMAVWNGTTWEPFSTPAFVGAPEVNSMALFDDGGGPALYIAGSGMQFGATANTNVARLRNGDWEGLPPLNVDGSQFPLRLTVVGAGSEQRLYLSGVNTSAGGGNGGTGVVRWTAAGWVTEATPRVTSTGLTAGSVAAVALHDDGDGEATYFAGQFGGITPGAATPAAEGLPAQSLGLARNGRVEVVQRGLGGFDRFNTVTTQPYELKVMDLGNGPRLVVAGGFSRAGGLYSPGAAMYDGDRFTPMATAGVFVQALGSAVIDGVRRPVGALGVNGTAMSYWNGSAWVALPGYFGPRPLFSIEFGGALYVMSASSMFKYVGGVWTSLPILSGRSAVVADIGNGPRLYVAGAQGGLNGVWSFDGAAWTPVGPFFAAPVDRIIVHNDGAGLKLYVTEGATNAGLPTNRISRWDGAAWRSLGLGLSGGPTNDIALASFDDGTGPALYALGSFTFAGSSSVRGFARWRNGVWEDPATLTTFPVFNGRYALAVFENKLYIAGSYREFDNLPADNLIAYGVCESVCRADFNGDGDVGTDADVEAFFACLAGNCCATCGTADFNNDGDVGTDADIESFFRVLAGGNC